MTQKPLRHCAEEVFLNPDKTYCEHNHISLYHNKIFRAREDISYVHPQSFCGRAQTSCGHTQVSCEREQVSCGREQISCE